MSPKFNPPANRYSHTPRKVFDKAMDRQDLRLKRVKEDYRADLKAMVQRLINLEDTVGRLVRQIERHFPIEDEFDVEELPDGRWRRRSTEGL